MLVDTAITIMIHFGSVGAAPLGVHHSTPVHLRPTCGLAAKFLNSLASVSPLFQLHANELLTTSMVDQ